MKRLAWSGIGFAFLITALTLQYFFLVNAAFGWALIENTASRTSGSFSNDDLYRVSLSQSSGGTAGNTFLEAFKASIANIVAFSMVIGRAGLLEIWLLVLFGTVGFELNRTLITRFGFDGPGTMHIFLYGAFVGLIASLLLRCRETKPETQTGRHELYTSNKFSSTLALLGTVICFVFFPFLGFDPVFSSATAFSTYLIPLNIVCGLVASTVGAMCTSALLNGKLNIRDMVIGPLAGGVAVTTAGSYITDPVFSLTLGAFVGIFQVMIMNIVRGKIGQGDAITTSSSFTLFGLNGLIGSAWAAWSNAFVTTDQGNFTFTAFTESHFEILMGLMSIAFGIGIGLILGLLFLCTGQHTRRDHFTDYTYWMDDDGISYSKPSSVPVPVASPAPGPSNNVEMEFFEGDN